MMNDPDLQRVLIRERHEELRRVAGRTRLRRDTRRQRRSGTTLSSD
jgi:hypothetical protein